jgi:hypothetical protein
MNAVLMLEENTGAQLIALAVRAMARLVVWLVWTVLQGAVALCSWWRPFALAALLVGAVALCVACPLFPTGLAITAAVAWATYPKGGSSNGH